MATRLNILLRNATKALVFAVFAANASPIKFSELKTIIKEKNLHVKAANENTLSSEEREGHFFRSWLPEITAEAGYETFKRETLDQKTQPYAGARAEINIFRAGSDSLEEKVRTLEANSSRASQAVVYRDELLKAQIAYLSVAFHQEQKSLLEKHLARTRKHLEAARRRINAGSATSTDRIEFDMAIRLAEQDISRVDLEIENNKRLLNILIGKDEAQAISVVETLPLDALLSGTDIGTNANVLPEIQIARDQGQVAALKAKQASRSWLPSLDIYSSVAHLNQFESDEANARDRNQYAVGVKLSMNLFDRGDSFAEGRSARALAKAKEVEATQTARELAVEMKNSERELYQLSLLIKNSSKDVEMVEDFVKRILGEYGRGVRSSSEVLSATERSLELQKRNTELRRDFQISKARLEALAPISN